MPMVGLDPGARAPVASSARLAFVCEAQPVLLGDDPSVLQLARLPRLAPTRPETRVAVNRSLPFEFLVATAGRVAETWGAALAFDYSGYDPALATPLTSPRDVTVCWIDWRIQQRTLSPAAAAAWAVERVRACRQGAEPVLINDWPELAGPDDEVGAGPGTPRSWVRRFGLALQEAVEPLPGVHVLELAALAATLGTGFADRRNDEISSYPFSRRASTRIAQHLAGSVLPALLQPRRKVVVVDLDNTLYDGVLGEDGAAGVTVTEGHRVLGRGLAALRRAGVLLAISSKNDSADVAEFLAGHAGPLGLGPDDFSAVAAGWDPKPAALQGIAARLGVGTDSLVFVDDNPAELAQVAERLPDVALVRAADGHGTWQQLSRLPGTYTLAADAAADVRAADLAAQRDRDALRAGSADRAHYLAALGMRLAFAVNAPGDTARVHQLSHKTNQFNLALRRMSEQDAAAAAQPPHLTLTVRVSDAFSDSGLVGALVARVDGRRAVVEEVLLSCRVLGRHVEDLGLAALLDRLAALGVSGVSFAVTGGPRNGPARDWRAGLPASDDLDEIRQALRSRTADIPVEVSWL